MDSLLRDINRERQKMQSDVEKLSRHYEQLQTYVSQYVQQTTIEWAKLIVDHPKATLLIVETTRILNESGFSTSGDNEPIRLTTLALASGEIWDLLLYPSRSQDVGGTEYHGLAKADLEDRLVISEAWPEIAGQLENRHIIVFGADHARDAIRTVYPTHVLDGAACLHNRCKEFYGEFYELSLERILGYQNIDRKREDMKDSRERVLVLAEVMRNLAVGMTKRLPEEEDSDLDDLDAHPF
jgi:DNA polymerase III epsilon subunit-like protein